MKARTACLAGIAAVALLGSAAAEAMRCGSRIIGRGDHAAKLLDFCGEPSSVRSRLAQRTPGSARGQMLLPGFIEEVWIEEWTYNFGPYKLMRQVRLENGVVTEIRHLGYGYLP